LEIFIAGNLRKYYIEDCFFAKNRSTFMSPVDSFAWVAPLSLDFLMSAVASDAFLSFSGLVDKNSFYSCTINGPSSARFRAKTMTTEFLAAIPPHFFHCFCSVTNHSVACVMFGGNLLYVIVI
jgi:hypothetical protein